ncbi:TRAP transporter large permease subunit, partial [Chloroflexota bacterium]
SAGIIVGCVGMTSLDYKFSAGLINMAGGNLMLVLVVAAGACIILGMGLPTVPAYILVALIVTPALVPLGIEPVVIHMFVFYFALAAMVTPPVAGNVFVAAPMVNRSIWSVGGHAVRLGMATYIVPFMFVLKPALLLSGGGLLDTLYAMLIAIVATTALCFALARHGIVSASWAETILALLAAVVTFLPVNWGFPVGGSLIVTIAVYQATKFLRKRGTKIQGSH